VVRVSGVLTKSFGCGCIGCVSKPLAGRPAILLRNASSKKYWYIKECKVGVCEVVEEVEDY